MAITDSSQGGMVLSHEDQDGFLTVTAFEGAITTKLLPHKSHDRAFAFEILFRPQHRRLLGAPKPPMHFHVHQDEYLQVLQGTLVVEMDYGGEIILRPEDGEFTVPQGEHHRLYTCPPGGPDGAHEEVKVLLSGEHTGSAYKLDVVFFENWYAYQEKVVLGSERVRLIQVLSMFDAAGTYLSFPRWVPFRSLLARVLGVVGGRWIGGLLGYQPYYKEWTTDWEVACQTMETSMFWRRFVTRKTD